MNEIVSASASMLKNRSVPYFFAMSGLKYVIPIPIIAVAMNTHPEKVFASLHTTGLDNILAVLNPIAPFGGRRFRAIGTF